MAALAVVPAPAIRNLYDIEQHLAALIDCEETVPAELEAEYDRELRHAMIATVEKRDRVGHFMAHLESQSALAATEIKRLQERKALFERVFARVEGYVSRVIEDLGLDAKGKRQKLEGNTVTFSLRGCDKRAEIINETAVPAKYKRVTVTLSADLWDLLCDSLDMDFLDRVLGEAKRTVEVSTTLVKADLKADIAVPGAQLAGGTYLVRK